MTVIVEARALRVVGVGWEGALVVVIVEVRDLRGRWSGCVVDDGDGGGKGRHMGVGWGWEWWCVLVRWRWEGLLEGDGWR